MGQKTSAAVSRVLANERPDTSIIKYGRAACDVGFGHIVINAALYKKSPESLRKKTLREAVM